MSWIHTLFLGSDPEADEARGAAADAALRQLIQEDLDSGRISPEVAAESFENIDRGVILDAEGQVNRDFSLGLEEGFDNVTGAVKATLDAPRKFLFAAVPWYFWVLGAVALVAWLNPRFFAELLKSKR